MQIPQRKSGPFYCVNTLEIRGTVDTDSRLGPLREPKDFLAVSPDGYVAYFNGYGGIIAVDLVNGASKFFKMTHSHRRQFLPTSQDGGILLRIVEQSWRLDVVKLAEGAVHSVQLIHRNDFAAGGWEPELMGIGEKNFAVSLRDFDDEESRYSIFDLVEDGRRYRQRRVPWSFQERGYAKAMVIYGDHLHYIASASSGTVHLSTLTHTSHGEGTSAGTTVLSTVPGVFVAPVGWEAPQLVTFNKEVARFQRSSVVVEAEWMFRCARYAVTEDGAVILELNVDADLETFTFKVNRVQRNFPRLRQITQCAVELQRHQPADLPAWHRDMRDVEFAERFYCNEP